MSECLGMELLPCTGSWENESDPGCAGAAWKCNPQAGKRALVKTKGLLIILTTSSFIHVSLQALVGRLQPGISVKSALGMFFLPLAALYTSSGWRCTRVCAPLLTQSLKHPQAVLQPCTFSMQGSGLAGIYPWKG